MKLFLTLILFFLFHSSLNAQTEKWTKKANFAGAAFASPFAFTIGAKAYIGTSYFWEYNSSSDVWTQKADFAGFEKQSAVGFSIGTKGYLGTGWTTQVSYTRDFWEYNPSTNSWTQKAIFPGTGRIGATGFSIGNKGYMGLGYDGSQNRLDFWEYNPDSNRWRARAPYAGGPKVYSVSFVIGNKGYITLGGGSNYELWEFFPDSNKWFAKTNFPGAPRNFAIGFSILSKGYIGTGDTGSSRYAKDLWEYSPKSNAWTRKMNLTGKARSQAVGFSIGTKGYIALGDTGNNNLCNEIWEYSPPIGILFGNIDTNVCASSNFSVPFTFTESYADANIFKVQLSDASGNFASAINIGQRASNVSGTIQCIIPAFMPIGSAYKIRIIATEPSDTSKVFSGNISINPKPSSGFISNSLIKQCLSGNSFSFTDYSTLSEGTLSRIWNFGDNTFSTVSNPIKKFTTAGNFDVRIIAISNKGCKDSISQTITVLSEPQVAITTNDSTTVCSGKKVKLNASTNSSGIFSWLLNKSTNILVSDSFYEAYLTGNYSAILTDSNGCKDTSNEININVIEIPSAYIFSSGDTVFCEGDSVYLQTSTGNNYQYTWFKNDVIIVGANSNRILVKEHALYKVKINNGCEALSPSVLITINPIPNKPVISQSGNLLQSNSTSNNQWYFGSAMISGAKNQTYQPTQNGTYFVSITNSFDCVNFSDGFLFASAGIIEVDAKILIDIYPNPSNGFFEIVSNEKIGQIELYAINGEHILTRIINSKIAAFDLNPAKGFYIVKCISQHGIAIRRLIFY